jgi:hypothetical protein
MSEEIEEKHHYDDESISTLAKDKHELNEEPPKHAVDTVHKEPEVVIQEDDIHSRPTSADTTTTNSTDPAEENHAPHKEEPKVEGHGDENGAIKVSILKWSFNECAFLEGSSTASARLHSAIRPDQERAR